MTNAFTEFADKEGVDAWSKIKNFPKFLKLSSPDPERNYTGSFDYTGWLESLDIPKSEWCPFWEQHSNKDEGFKPYSDAGERWGGTCLHDCRKDIDRGWA